MLERIGDDTEHSRTSEKDSLHGMLDGTGQDNRKRKAKSDAIATGFKRRRKI